MSELLLVCIPGGRLDATGGLLRILLVPRLTGPGTNLRDYGLDTWPDVIRNARFELRLRTDAAAAPHALIAQCRTDVQAEVWSGFFSPDFAVKPYAGQKTFDNPLVDPTTAHAEQITAAYQTSAVAIADPVVVRDQYGRLELDDPRPPLPRVVAGPAFMPPDFHRTVAMLREHPRVLRALGMIVDLTVPRAALTATGPTGQISAGWPEAPAGVGTVVSPWTAYETTASHFMPQSTPMITAGMVDLRTSTPVIQPNPGGWDLIVDQPDWVVTTVDVDAAVSRLSDAKASIEAGPADTRATLPALRTVGLMLMHRDRGKYLARRAARARANAGRAEGVTESEPLTADDLVLGYRLDVKLSGEPWHSLTRRLASYTVAGRPIGGGALVEEAHTKPAAAVMRPDDLIIGSEAVVRWDGWSLAVPREPLVRSGTPPHQQLPMPYDFKWKFELDANGPPIPELRFGSHYRLRMRVVDLAGGGLALDEPVGDTTATDLVLYGRLEPISAPVVPPPDGLIVGPPDATGSIDHALLGPGGSVDVMVIRSDPKGTPPDFAVTYPSNDRRTILPPPMNFTLADQHAALDGADAATWANARRALTPPTATATDTTVPAYTWLPDRAGQGVSLAPLWPEGASAAFPALRNWDTGHWPDYEAKHVTLVASADNFVLADWATENEARIALPAGRRINLEISSTLQDDYLDHFAAGVWMTGHADAVSAAIAGRHPIVTPAHTVTLVHAVRRPLTAPHGALAATRAPGDTSAVIADPQLPLLGVDRDSTAQLDVSAAWDEWTDAGEPTPMSEVVRALPVGRLDARLAEIRHEFGDTRHRAITYTLTARSRFRQYFAQAEPEAAFAVSTPTAMIHVPCSARPTPPVILSVVPAFKWETSDTGGVITRVRHGGRLRVELARPWYTTGQGESLAVVTAPDVPAGNLAPTTTAEWAFLTAAYRDPLASTPPLGTQPTASAFIEAIRPASTVRDIESKRDVTVVPYPVWYTDGRRFADIVISGLADESYTPMITLSLGRYQQFSLQNLALSKLVRTDYVPLLPTRVLTVVRTGQSVFAQLAGLGPTDPTSNRVDIRLESRDGPVAAPGQDLTGELTAINNPGGEVGWQSVSTTQTALNVASSPIVIPSSGQTYRLVVREIENLRPSLSAPAGPLPINDPLVEQLSARSVFVDVVAL